MIIDINVSGATDGFEFFVEIAHSLKCNLAKGNVKS